MYILSFIKLSQSVQKMLIRLTRGHVSVVQAAIRIITAFLSEFIEKYKCYYNADYGPDSPLF